MIPNTIPGTFQIAADGSIMFPPQPGLTMEFTVRPTFSTIVQTATDRSSTTLGLDPFPLWEYDLAFGYVSDDGTFTVPDATKNPAALTQYEQIMGLFLACGGRRDTFLMDLAQVTKKPDSTVNNVNIGIGDGSATQFQLCRPIGGFLDLIDNPINASVAITAISGGTPTLLTPSSIVNGLVTLAAPPSAGTIITASFDWLHRMRFTADAEEFDSMLLRLYSRGKLKLRQERNPSA
jgi:uncharacterized protein (TIGR02217 family)